MSRYKRCHQCRGKGYRVNPAVESPGGGITSSEMQEILRDDPDFITDMLEGRHDITCDLCAGAGRLLNTPEAREHRAMRREMEAEQAMECRMLGEY